MRSSPARSCSVEHAFGADGTLQITARCQDAAHRLRADSQLRVFVDVSVAELVRELAVERRAATSMRPTRVRACRASCRTVGRRSTC